MPISPPKVRNGRLTYDFLRMNCTKLDQVNAKHFCFPLDSTIHIPTMQLALYHQLLVDPEKHSPHNMQNLLYKIWLLEFDRLNDTIQFNHFLPKPWQACCKNSLVMPRAGLLLGRQQGQGEGRGGGRGVSERPPMLGDAIGLRSRGRGGGIPASPPSYQPQNFPPSNMVENRAPKFFAKGVANIRINLVKAKKIGYDHGIRLMVTKIFFSNTWNKGTTSVKTNVFFQFSD